jgi:endoglucanase
VGPDAQVTGIHFPGPPAVPLTPDPSLKLNSRVIKWIQDYNTNAPDKNPCGPVAFEGKLRMARAWSDYYGRPIHLGEFGCYMKIDAESRAHFYGAFRRALDHEKTGWAIWDWSAAFCYWDRTNGRPMPGLHEALFGGGK